MQLAINLLLLWSRLLLLLFLQAAKCACSLCSDTVEMCDNSLLQRIILCRLYYNFTTSWLISPTALSHNTACSISGEQLSTTIRGGPSASLILKIKGEINSLVRFYGVCCAWAVGSTVQGHGLCLRSVQERAANQVLEPLISDTSPGPS